MCVMGVNANNRASSHLFILMAATWNAKKAKELYVLQRPEAKVLFVSHSLGVSGQGYRWVTFSITEAASGFKDLSLESRGKVV